MSNKYLDAYKRGLSLVDICKVFDITMAELTEKFKNPEAEIEAKDKDDVKPRTNFIELTEEKKEQICRTFLNGLSIQKIADSFRLSNYMVYKVLIEAGLDRLGPNSYTFDYENFKKHKKQFLKQKAANENNNLPEN